MALVFEVTHDVFEAAIIDPTELRFHLLPAVRKTVVRMIKLRKKFFLAGTKRIAVVVRYHHIEVVFERETCKMRDDIPKYCRVLETAHSSTSFLRIRRAQYPFGLDQFVVSVAII